MITDLWDCITIREFQAGRCGQRGITGPSYTTLHLFEHVSVKVSGLCIVPSSRETEIGLLARLDWTELCAKKNFNDQIILFIGLISS